MAGATVGGTRTAGGGIVAQLLAEPQDLLATMVLGNTFASAAMLAVALWMAIHGHWPPALTMVSLLVLILIGCEVLPKTLAVRRPERWSLRVAQPMSFVCGLACRCAGWRKGSHRLRRYRHARHPSVARAFSRICGDQAGRADRRTARCRIPIIAHLDQPGSLARLARLAPVIVHLAPPQSAGVTDQRTRHLAAVLPSKATLVYMSTTGVYGDCGGQFVDETRVPNPQNARAQRRVDAEQTLRAWARRSGSRLSILRVPGILRPDRLPIERLTRAFPHCRRRTTCIPTISMPTSLARIVALALTRGAPCRVYHAVDDSCMKMGEYFDAVAQQFDLPKAPRLPRAELKSRVSPMLWSFMAESLRLSNRRIKSELGVVLRYARVADALPLMRVKDA